MKYKCKICGFIADIDKEAKTVHVYLPPGTQTFPVIGHACELAKAVDEIDLTKLEEVE